LTDRIAKYEVLEKIAEGGFGVVYKARDPFIKRLVAIKTCSVADQEMARRFFREAEIAGRFDHPNVTVVHDFGVEGQLAYLVQEYLTGEDLVLKIRRRDPIPVVQKIDWLLQAAAGLGYAHAKQVIHRDIKPANLRVLESGVLKILDFGIAKLVSGATQLTQKGVAVGTLGYLSPEQLRDQELDTRTDIFSFGVVAHELLTYTKPFQGKQLSVLMDEILHREPPPVSSLLPDAPASLDLVVARCLTKDRDARYQSFAEVISDLRVVRRELAGSDAVSLYEGVTPSGGTVLPAVPPGPAQRTPERNPEEEPSTRPVPLPPLPPPAPPSGQVPAFAVAMAHPEALTSSILAPQTMAPQTMAPPAIAPPAIAPSASTPSAVTPPGIEPSAVAAAAGTPGTAAPLAAAPALAAPAGASPEVAAVTGAAVARAAVSWAPPPLAVPPPPPAAPRPAPPPRPPVPPPGAGAGPGERSPSRAAASAPSARVAGEPPAGSDVLPAAELEPVERSLPPSRPSAPGAGRSGGASAAMASVPPPPASAAVSRPAPAAVRSGAPTSPRPRWLLPAIGGAALLLVLLAAGVWWILAGRGSSDAEAEPEPITTATQAPAVPGQASILVIAAPWGELVGLRDDQGEQLPLPTVRETPLLLALAPGHYTLTLGHPAAAQTATCEVDATLDAAATCRVELLPPEPMQYFKEAGWWQ
jgi:serine/threonine-protein kinase